MLPHFPFEASRSIPLAQSPANQLGIFLRLSSRRGSSRTPSPLLFVYPHTSASIANGYHISSSISPSLPLFPKYPSIFSRTNSPIHPANPSPKYRTAQTRWFGSKKFAIPSLTRYSCPQFPHTSIPSLTLVSNNSVCSSLIIFSSFSSSSFVGAVGGWVGKPSYIHRSVSLHSSRPGENSGAEEGDEGGRGRGGGNKLQKQ